MQKKRSNDKRIGKPIKCTEVFAKRQKLPKTALDKISGSWRFQFSQQVNEVNLSAEIQGKSIHFMPNSLGKQEW
jgi:hypothetical protein